MLSTEEEHGELLYAGDHVKVKLQFHVPGFLPLPYVIIREVLKRHNGETWSFEDSVIPNFRGSGDLLFQTPPLERGRYQFMETECVSEDIFGLIEHKGNFNVIGQFRVLPRTVCITSWQMYDRHSRLSGPQATLAASRRETTQINGVRDYVYGDRISRIHWNATARTGSWKSKEFEYDSVPKTLLVLDTTASNYASPQQFELAVSTAASMLEYAKRERMCLGLVVVGHNIKAFQPSDLEADRQRMMHYLVDVGTDGTGKVLTRLEKGSRHIPHSTFFTYISPQSGQPVADVFRWAESRGMKPSHIVLGGTGNRHESWVKLLRSRGLFGGCLSDLSELPALLGGFRT